MSKSYIVETDDETQLIVEIGVNSTGAALITTHPVRFLTPYAEPDLNQAMEDAFKNGYDAARKDIDVKSKINAAYQKGLEDAWDAARKIIHMPEADLLNLFTECYSAVCTSVQVFLKYDASEAIEKIRQYEQEKEQQIQIGDEVNGKGGRGIITKISDDGNHFNVMWENGLTGCYRTENFKKTGRNFPEIAEVLRKMQEEKE